MRVKAKTKEDQEIAYLHKSRQNAIQQRIQRSNSLMHSLFEFGYLVTCGKSKFASQCLEAVKRAFEEGFISLITYKQMTLDCKEIHQLLMREKALDKEIDQRNKGCARAKLLQTIPGIGPINASLLSIKSVDLYPSAKDFSASLGLVPKQHTTGGKIILGSITKQGDRYARTMLIQAARSLLMNSYRRNLTSKGALSAFIERLKAKGKSFNIIAVALANKLARIAYACLLHHAPYQA